jgi:hypothetical protein
VNQCNGDQEHILDENNRATESGQLQVTIVKPHSFEVLGEIEYGRRYTSEGEKIHHSSPTT